MYSSSNLPYKVIGKAKTGRANCHGCKNNIEKGTLRIARMVESIKIPKGKKENWYHEQCFFEKQRPKSVSEIDDFNKLQNEDQQRLIIKVDQANKAAMVVSGNDETDGKSMKRSLTKGPLGDFGVAYSSNNRARCKHCDIKICKGEIRIFKKLYDTDIAKRFGSECQWYHVSCFEKDRRKLLFFAGGDELPGLRNLSEEDQQMVRDNIRPMNPEDEVTPKKIKTDPEERSLEQVLWEQNNLYQSYKTELSNWSPKDISYMLKENNQIVTKNKQQALELLADCMAFGALRRCPECGGQLVLDNFDYKCTGRISEFSSCPYAHASPVRAPLRVPAALSSRELLAGYRPGVRDRRLRPRPPQTTSVKREVGDPPLKNLQFFVYGRDLSKNKKDEIKQRIFKMGGLVVAKLTETTAAVVSTQSEIERMNDRMAEIAKQEIEVVEESFLDQVDPESGSVRDSLLLICMNNIANWGSDPINRVPRQVIEGKPIETCGNNYVMPSTSKKIIKDGAVVESAELADIAHVYCDSLGNKHTEVLSQTDLVSGKNCFYKLQLLESDDDDRYYVYTAWGQIGSEGDHKQEDFYNLESALDYFKSKYFEKTKNNWDNRQNFVKHPWKYYPHSVDYSEAAAALEAADSSRPARAVRGVLQLMFDLDRMRRSVREFRLDADRLPLGKISQKQICDGFEVLKELLQHVENGLVSKSKIIDASSRFYTLIPHKFDGQPPLLNSKDLIQNKIEILDDLMQIDLAFTMRNADVAENSLEECYKKLKTEITPLDESSEDFLMIEEYVKNTHVHREFSLEIVQVFKVVREGEAERFEPFKKLHNHKLLWHGSRVSNFPGILSQGLRIAPPEAPWTAFMFGKGIYFADKVSKSAQYCRASKDSPDGILLLCEVALGNMKECVRAEHVRRLSPDTHSVFGAGRAARAHSELRYNEFVVYDPAQVNIKYLLQIKFKY